MYNVSIFPTVVRSTPIRTITMQPFLDALKIEITCEACGNKTKQTIEWIKANNELTCKCGAVFRFAPADFKTQIADAERSFNSLTATVKNINK